MPSSVLVRITSNSKKNCFFYSRQDINHHWDERFKYVEEKRKWVKISSANDVAMMDNWLLELEGFSPLPSERDIENISLQSFPSIRTSSVSSNEEEEEDDEEDEDLPLDLSIKKEESSTDEPMDLRIGAREKYYFVYIEECNNNEKKIVDFFCFLFMYLPIAKT